MNSEPAAGIGTFISALLALVWVILDSTGANLTDNLKGAVEAFIYALMAMPLIAGFLIRLFVTPTGHAEAKINQAYVATPGVDPKPTL